MLKNKIYFVTAIGTDIGKTYFTTKICKKLISEGKKVSAIKPISSGFGMFDEHSDTAKILNSLGKKLNEENFEEVTKWHFVDPISPHLAAKKSGQEIKFDEVVKFCQEKIALAQKNNEFLFIEGAGGVMSPINYQKTFLDLTVELKIPVILLTANYLGAISHSLTSIESLKNKKVEIAEILINVFKKEVGTKINFLSYLVDAKDMELVLENQGNNQVSLIEDFLRKK